VRRKHFDGVVELQDFFVERIVEQRRHVGCREAFGTDEIGPADIADEEGVAGQHADRFGVVLRVGDEDADAFGRVSRRLHDIQA